MALRDYVVSIVVRARDQAGAALQNLRNRLRDTGRDTETLSDKFRGLALRIGALAGTYLGINTLRSALQGILSTGATFEKYGAQVAQVMGSIEGGKQATAWIKDFTAKTPFDIGETTQAFIKLKAFGLDPMDGTFEALANQAAALGGSQETLNGVILATGQAWAKQKLQGEEILQLVERGVPVWDLLSKATGKNVLELQKMSEAGQLGRKEIAALVATMGQASAGALQGQMGTLSGMLARVRSEWTSFVNLIAESGLQEYAKEQIGKLLDAIKTLRENGKLQEWADKISAAFVRLGESTKSLLVGSLGSIETFAEGASTGMGKLADTFTVVSNGAAFMVNSLKVIFNGAVTTLSGFLSTMMQLVAKAARALGDDEFAGTADAIAASMNAVFDEYTARMQANAADLQHNMDGIWGAIAGDATEAATKTADAAQKVVELTGQALRQAADQAAAEVERLKADAESLEASQAAAASRVQQAWERALQEQGSGQADAIANLNAAIQTETDLRIQAAENAKALNTATAESHKLVTKAAEEAAKGQGKAAEEARTNLQKLGIDAGTAINKVSDAASNSIGSLEKVAVEIKAIGADTRQSADIMGQAMRKALQDVSTAEEFKAIKAKIRSLFDTGQIDSAALQSALAAIRAREEEIQGKPLDEPGKKLAAGMAEGKGAIDAAAEAANRLKASTDGAAESAKGSFGSGLAAVLNGVTASMHALGAAAGAAFERIQFDRGILTGIDDLKAKLAAAEAETDRLASTMSQTFSGSFASYFTQLALNASQVREEFYRQKLQLDSLLQSVERGGMSMSALDAAGRRAATQFDLLDATDLSGLQSAIDSARSRLDSLNASAESTLDNLRQRLAQVRGDTEQAEELRYQSERKNLERQLDEARESGATDAARDYQQALDQLRQIRDVERQNARDRATEEAERKRQAEDRQAAEKAQQQMSNRASEPTRPTTPAPTGQRIILQAPGGKEVEVTTADPTGLLAALEQAGLRNQA